MDNVSKTGLTLLAAVAAGLAGLFLKDAWDDAKAREEEAANPRTRWTDAARWEK